MLIDIHGQHEHQSLLSKKKHLEILDAYAKDALGEKKERLAACYQEYRKLKKEWESSSLDTEERARELSFLAYEVKEIEEAQLSVGEDTRLEEQYRRFANAKKIMDAISAAGAATGGDGGTGENASELISRALREVSSVSAYEERIAQMEQMLTDIDNLLSDFNHEISSYLSGEEFDDEVFYQTEKRLDEINHLKSKYGNTMEEILQSAEEKTKRIAVLQDYDKYLNDLLTSMNRKKEELDGLCAEVSKIRKKAAKGLTKAIAQALEDLNFLDVQFTMEFRKTEYSAGGRDEAEFMISTNPGEPLKPLGKVASGGELSRIALAVKTVMADTDEIPTLIFDEIDSGISGRTAQMVSQKMKLLAKTHQIICITHLPQIAVQADNPQERGQELDAMLEALQACAAFFCVNQDGVTVVFCRSDWHRSETITEEQSLLPLLENLLETPPEADAAACLSHWESLGETAAFCVTDTVLENPPFQKVFTAKAAGSDKHVSIAGNGAEIVYRTLTDSEGGAA